MSDRAEREALARRILADARARAEAIAYGGVRANMLRAAERRAERVLAGLPVDPSHLPPRAPNVSHHLLDLDGNPRPTQRRPCLRCRSPFDSHGPGNRLCGECRARSADASPFAV